jgi:hypothetical protein
MIRTASETDTNPAGTGNPDGPGSASEPEDLDTCLRYVRFAPADDDSGPSFSFNQNAYATSTFS